MVLRTTRREARHGFTLMEMLVVVAIIVMLAGLGAWGYMRQLETSRESKAKLDITHLQQAVEAYKLEAGEYPDSLQVLAQPLNGKPAFLADEKELLDPWNQPYQYEPQNTNPNTGRPHIYSTHQTASGVISNW